MIAGALQWLVPIALRDAANSVLLPLAGIFVGLSFAWGGNAQALLGSSELQSMAKGHPGGLAEYVYAFQAAILTILITLGAWGVGGLGVFDEVWPTAQRPYWYGGVEGSLYFLASLTLRECWHVVLGSQQLFLLRARIKRHQGEGENLR